MKTSQFFRSLCQKSFGQSRSQINTRPISRRLFAGTSVGSHVGTRPMSRRLFAGTSMFLSMSMGGFGAYSLCENARQQYENQTNIGPTWFQDGDFGPNVHHMKSKAVTSLLTKIRDKNCTTKDYVMCSNRLLRLLAEEGLALAPGGKEQIINTPLGPYRGWESKDPEKCCAVSIIRSGDILLEAVLQCVPGIAVGKILIQRDETHPLKLPKLFYCKLPPDVAERTVLLVDPMIATGGSANMALRELIKRGVKEENVIFVNVIACPEGIRALQKKYPGVRVVTTCIDPLMDGNKYIKPGLGDFGDRYYSTGH